MATMFSICAVFIGCFLGYAHVYADTLLKKIEEAKIMMAPMPLKTITGKEHILLCALDGDRFRVVDIYYSEIVLKQYPEKQEVIDTATDDCFVEKIGGDGVATSYAIVCSARHLPVLAVKRRDRFGKEVVYTPYTDFLTTNEIIEAGKEYARALVKRAQHTLITLRVPSLAYPGHAVGEMQREYQARIVEALIINEHADYYVVRQIGMRPVFEKVLVILGTNKEYAYSHSMSTRAALGIGQITNNGNKKRGLMGTYDRARSDYPLAHLTADFSKGATDHLNAVKAMFCIIDRELCRLPLSVRERFRRKPHEVELLISAFYNAGSNRLNRFLKIFGAEKFDGNFAIPPIKGYYAMLPETWGFLRKHRQIMRLLE